MKHSSAELKVLARKALIGNYGLCIAASLLFGLFSIIIGFIGNWVFPVSGYSSSFMSVASYVFQFLTLLLVQVLNVGFYRFLSKSAVMSRLRFRISSTDLHTIRIAFWQLP